MIKKLLCFLLFLMLSVCCSFVFATPYAQFSGENSSFQNDGGIFRSGIIATTTGSAVVSDGYGVPLMDDLDGDGVQDVVILDGTVVKVFWGNTLSSEGSYASDVIGDYPHMILYDVDGDSKVEVIVSSSASPRGIEIIEFNGTHVYRQTNLTLPSVLESNTSLVLSGDVLIGCRGVDDCLAVYAGSNEQTTTLGRKSVYGSKFDSSQKYNAGLLYRNSAQITQNFAYCHPALKYLQAVDYDRDGESEYVFSMLEYGTTPLIDQLKLFYVGMNSSDQPLLEYAYSGTDIDIDNFQPGDGCHDPTDTGNRVAGEWLTEPLVADLEYDGSLETVVGYAVDSGTEFKMVSLYDSGAYRRTYPDVLNADGYIISNIILTDAFVPGVKKDFCVLGYRNNNWLDLLCGSETSVFSLLGFIDIHSDEFFFPYTATGLNNISTNAPWHNKAIHSSAQGFTSGQNDLITPYGVFSINFEGISSLFGSENSTLTLQYQSPHLDGAVVMLDAENNGKSDMLILDTNNLWYINDGFINAQAQITDITTNPCMSDVIRQNSTVSVQVTVQDFDGDAVSSAGSLYSGHPVVGVEQFSGWSENSSSGTTFFFTFQANVTGYNQIMRAWGRDAEHYSTNDTDICYFGVASNGVGYGDSECSCFADSVVVPGGATTTTLTGVLDADNNTITNFMNNELIDSFGLGSTVIWLIVMCVVAFGIWVQGSHLNPAITFGIVGFAEVLLYIIGAYLGFLPAWLIVSTVVVGLVAIGVWTYSMFLHKAGS